MKLQYISDVHLEKFKVFPKFKVTGDNLALLGDIGYPKTKIYKDFIEYCSNNWENVFLLYGNHEFYNYPTPKDKRDIQTVSSIKGFNKSNLMCYPNVYILDNDTIFIHKTLNTVTYRKPDPQFQCNYIKIIGSTLWSRIELKTSTLVNDYKYIYTDMNKLITPKETLNFFIESVEYIKSKLDTTKCDAILLTHHAIHDICNGKYQGNKMCSAFATTIPELFEKNNLKYAINGHTHESLSNKIKDVYLLSNCFGYNIQEREKFNECTILELE